MEKNKQTPMTWDDVVAVFEKLCDHENKYTPVGANTEDFMPMKLFHAIIDNENYDPEQFSQEIEDSEPDKVMDARHFHTKYFDPVWGWRIKNGEKEYEKVKNTREWLDNHSKNCPTSLVRIPSIFIAGQRKLKETYLGGEVKEYVWRDYKTEGNLEKMRVFYNGLLEKGLNLYELF